MVEDSVKKIQRLAVKFSGSTVCVKYNILRPIRRYAAQRGFADLDAYLREVEAHPEQERDRFLDHALIHRTEFYRDEKFWSAVDSHVFADTTATFNVLSLGCSNGSELASIAALVRQRFEPDSFTLTAIDVSPAMVERARNPAILTRELHKMKIRLEQPVFVPTDKKISRLRPEILARIRVEMGNVLDPDGFWWAPSTKYDLVLCRNLLLYLRVEDLPAVFSRIAASTRPGGFVGLGRVDPQPAGKPYDLVAPLLYCMHKEVS